MYMYMCVCVCVWCILALTSLIYLLLENLSQIINLLTMRPVTQFRK